MQTFSLDECIEVLECWADTDTLYINQFVDYQTVNNKDRLCEEIIECLESANLLNIDFGQTQQELTKCLDFIRGNY